MNQDRINQIITEQLCVDPAKPFTPDSVLGRDLGADSLDSVELIMLLEDEFNIDMPTEAISVESTVAQVHDAVAAAKK